MFPLLAYRHDPSYGFPRVSGDVSIPKFKIMNVSLFSPRERGCFRNGAEVIFYDSVFSA